MNMKKTDKINEALEMTTFKLKGCSCKEFISANTKIDEWLKKQPGFISRRIAEYENGTIVDMLIWKSVANGERAMNRIMTEMADSPVHDMIDQKTVSWNIAAVKHLIKE